VARACTTSADDADRCRDCLPRLSNATSAATHFRRVSLSRHHSQGKLCRYYWTGNGVCLLPLKRIAALVLSVRCTCKTTLGLVLSYDLKYATKPFLPENDLEMPS